MNPDRYQSFAPSFVMEIGRTKGSELLFEVDVERVVNDCLSSAYSCIPAQTHWQVAVSTQAMGYPRVHIDLSYLDIVSQLSSPIIRVRIPWGCPVDEINKLTMCVQTVAEKLRCFIFHPQNGFLPAFVDQRTLYAKNARKMAQEIEGLIEQTGISLVPLRPVSSLDLSVRTLGCFMKSDIRIVADFLSLSERQLLLIKNFGRRSLNEVRAIVEDDLGLVRNIDLSGYRRALFSILPNRICREFKIFEDDDDEVLSSLRLLADYLAPVFVVESDVKKNEEYLSPDEAMRRSREKVLKILNS